MIPKNLSKLAYAKLMSHLVYMGVKFAICCNNVRVRQTCMLKDFLSVAVHLF